MSQWTPSGGPGFEPGFPHRPPPPAATPPILTFRPRLRPVLLGFLVHHNPFYLLSALCMIAGCYALNDGLDLRAGEAGRALVLVGTINLYELMLIGLGVFLIRSRNIVRDGRTLLLLQAVFLADLTFLNAALANADLRVGVATNLALLGLAWVKVGAVLWGLSGRRAGAADGGTVRIPFPGRLFCFVAAELALLYGAPCVLAWFNRHGTIADRQVYAVWWIVGLLPAMAEAQRRLFGPSEGTAPPARPRMGRVYVVTIYASVLAHMGMMHWAYRVPFVAADAAPVLLGLAVAAHAARPASGRMAPGLLRAARFVLPALAVALSVWQPVDLGVSVGRGGRMPLTPVMLAAAVAFAGYVYVYALRYAPYLLATAAASAVLLLFGPTWPQLLAQFAAGWRWTADGVARAMPRTAVQWGITAVAAAFAFLGLGAVLSLSQGKAPRKQVPGPPDGEGGGA